LSIRALVAKI